MEWTCRCLWCPAVHAHLQKGSVGFLFSRSSCVDIEGDASILFVPMCILIPLLRCWFDCLISSWLPMFYGKHNFRGPCYVNDLQSYLKFGNLEWDKLLVCRLWYMLPLFCLWDGRLNFLWTKAYKTTYIKHSAIWLLRNIFTAAC